MSSIEDTPGRFAPSDAWLAGPEMSFALGIALSAAPVTLPATRAIDPVPAVVVSAARGMDFAGGVIERAGEAI